MSFHVGRKPCKGRRPSCFREKSGNTLLYGCSREHSCWEDHPEAIVAHEELHRVLLEIFGWPECRWLDYICRIDIKSGVFRFEGFLY